MDVTPRRPWTPADLATLRHLYRRQPTGEIARQFGRSTKSIYQTANKLGLAVRRRLVGEAVLAELRCLNELGWTDTEVAAVLGYERKTVNNWRRRLSLPSNRGNERYRARVAARTRVQCATAGVRNLGELRALVFARRTAGRGWPADLPDRAADILDVLAEQGPLTRREIAAAAGFSWLGSRCSMKCRGPHGSYLGLLMALGLVVNLGKIARGKGKGSSCSVYSLALECERRTGNAI